MRGIGGCRRRVTEEEEEDGEERIGFVNKVSNATICTQQPAGEFGAKYSVAARRGCFYFQLRS